MCRGHCSLIYFLGDEKKVEHFWSEIKIKLSSQHLSIAAKAQFNRPTVLSYAIFIAIFSLTISGKQKFRGLIGLKTSCMSGPSVINEFKHWQLDQKYFEY